jgi:hypothetical protein
MLDDVAEGEAIDAVGLRGRLAAQWAQFDPCDQADHLNMKMQKMLKCRLKTPQRPVSAPIGDQELFRRTSKAYR